MSQVQSEWVLYKLAWRCRGRWVAYEHAKPLKSSTLSCENLVKPDTLSTNHRHSRGILSKNAPSCRKVTRICSALGFFDIDVYQIAHINTVQATDRSRLLDDHQGPPPVIGVDRRPPQRDVLVGARRCAVEVPLHDEVPRDGVDQGELVVATVPHPRR